MIKPKLHHVTIKTSHLDEMITWYGLVIGAEVQFRDQVAAWTTNDAANHRIAFLAVPGLSDDAQKVNHNGMHHCAFEYESFEDLMGSIRPLPQGRRRASILSRSRADDFTLLQRSRGKFRRAAKRQFWRLGQVNRIHAHVGRLRRQSDRYLLRSGSRLRKNEVGC